MTGGRRALVVDDEEPLARLVAGYLTRDGFSVDVVADGEAAVEAARRQRPDLIVLDLMLPGIDGVEACRRIRTFSDAYIVMLTARVEEIDVLVGLSVGADDYITKPFSPRELIARIHAMQRRPRAAREGGAPLLVIGALEIDRDAHELRLDGALIDATPLELALLAALADQPNVAFTRRQLLDRVWGETWVGDEHVVDVHVANLRRKLGAAAPRYIRTVRGVGYRFGAG